MKTVQTSVIALFLCVSATVACSNKSSTTQTSPGQRQSPATPSLPQVQKSAEPQPQQAPVQQIYTKRDNQDVTIPSLNFQGQTGSYTYMFAAK